MQLVRVLVANKLVCGRGKNDRTLSEGVLDRSYYLCAPLRIGYVRVNDPLAREERVRVTTPGVGSSI